VAAVSGSEIWAVGDRITDRHTNTTSTLAMRVCPIQVLDSGFASDAGRADQGATAAWSFAASDVQTHRVADASGMGLFDSGDRQPGTSFTFAFPTAGAYPIIDLATSSRFRLSIATVAAPPSGNLSTTFTVRWSSDALDDGYVADVQIKRPGETSFSDWLVGQVTGETTFTADAGPGAYEFRARLRSTTNGTATGYSPAGSIAVES
jgi:plastocyanin